MTEHAADAPPRDEPAAGAPTPVDSANDEPAAAVSDAADNDEDFEDLEFLLDDIEDQIAPLG